MEQTKQDSLLQKLNRIKIYEMGLPLYLCVFALVFVAMLLGWLPGGMLGAFLVMMVYGGLFNLIGNNTPSSRPTWGAAPSCASSPRPSWCTWA